MRSWQTPSAARPGDRDGATAAPPGRPAPLGRALGPPGYLGHDGGTSGFQAMLGLRPHAGQAAAVMVNDRAASGLPRAVRQSLEGETGR
jgi:hypothetical protein